MSSVTRADRGFTIVRRFDAPRELVFRAWTEPEHLHWYAGTFPNEWPTTVDLRVGGAWRFHMIENEERSYPTGGIYREIEPPRRLAFSWGAVDGWPALDPDRLDEAPLVTITLNELPDGGTEMVFEVSFSDELDDAGIRRWLATGMVEGWTMTLDRLTDATIAGQPAIR